MHTTVQAGSECHCIVLYCVHYISTQRAGRY